MKRNENKTDMETGNKKQRMTASEKRFAKEMELLVQMSLNDLLQVEKNRMPVGVWYETGKGTVKRGLELSNPRFLLHSLTIVMQNHWWIYIFGVQSLTN